LAGARMMSSQAAAKPGAARGVVFGRSAVLIPDWSAFALVERTHGLAEGTLRGLYKNPAGAVRRVLSGEPVQGAGVLLGEEVRGTGQRLRDDAGYQAGPWEEALARALGEMLSKVRSQKRTAHESPFYSQPSEREQSFARSRRLSCATGRRNPVTSNRERLFWKPGNNWSGLLLHQVLPPKPA